MRMLFRMEEEFEIVIGSRKPFQAKKPHVGDGAPGKFSIR